MKKPRKLIKNKVLPLGDARLPSKNKRSLFVLFDFLRHSSTNQSIFEVRMVVKGFRGNNDQAVLNIN